jgi:hypothetical protein
MRVRHGLETFFIILARHLAHPDLRAFTGQPPAWRLLMTLQAYIDESSDENGVFVLAGCISDAESWAAFTKETNTVDTISRCQTWL